MTELQALTRSLLSAGYATSKEGKEQYLLYVSPKTPSFLQCQQWSGDSLTRETLIVDSVRPESTAAYLITPRARLVICISPTSALSAYTYDSEEREWIEHDEEDDELSIAPLPPHAVHPEGKFAACVDASGRVHLVFQDQAKRLVYLDNSWHGTILTAGPIAGSPISISAIGHTVHIFYVSATDSAVHDVAGTNGNWTDRELAINVGEKGVKNFTLAGTGSGDKEFYVLTKDDTLMKIDGEGRVVKLGSVRMGKFISERSVDNCALDAWNGTLTQLGLNTYIAEDPSCIDAPGSEHAVTPLAAACIRGHLDVVRLLLQNGANPNALSPQKRTPLYYATSTSEGRDRCAIVRALLEAGADVDKCYAENGFNTPLMNAITLISDQGVVDVLLKHGASPTAKDVAGHSVEMLAKGTPMEGVVAEKVEQGSSTPFEKQLIEFLVTLMMFVVAYTNSKRVKDLVGQIVIKLKEMKDAQDEPKSQASSETLKDSAVAVVASVKR